MSWRGVLLAIVAVAVVAAVAVTSYVARWQQQPLSVDGRELIVIERGEAFGHLAHRLHERGVVDHPRLWTWLARLSGDARRVQAGEYEMRQGDSPVRVLQRFVDGEVVTYDVKLLEGWTAMQAVAELARHPALDVTLDGVTVHTLLEVLGLPGGHAEGLFFPDTYHFVRGDSDADILRRAYVRMQSVLDAAWEDRDAGLPYDSPYQALIAASLIEKETGREDDRPLISQVFALRLERGMRLQTDPAVIYGLGDRFDGDLRRADLRAPGPYNTYRNRGLPPTPIALPGQRSIHAALHPADGEYLYFVSRGDGSSKFSVSLDEHEAAVRRYQMP